jgi:hypothetical protein
MDDTSLPKTIPAELPGAVCQQWVKCGKPRCHCARGELHGPYWYRIWRDAFGSSCKEYVRPADLEAVRAACTANRAKALAVNATLARGRHAVKWLTAARGARPSGSIVKWIERIVGSEAAVSDLVVLACGQGDRPLDSLRAFELLTPLLHPILQPHSAPPPSRSTAAVERIALGYDPADFTA